MNGIGSHQSAKSKNTEWLTPPELITKLRDFDLDPCAPIKRPWPTAKNHFTIEDNGLQKEWFGKVWCNPPYGKDTFEWLSKCAKHGNSIALIFARTETKMFFSQVWGKADAVFFIKGRLHFHYVDGSRAKANSGAPSVLIAYGKENAKILKSLDFGQYIPLNTTKA